MDKRFRVPLKESYLLIIIIVGILSLCMYSSFALFSLEKTTSKDIFTMKAASDIETTLKIFEYKKITVSAGDNTSVMVNVNNDTGGSIYYGVFYEMVSPSTKTDDIGIYKIDWSANATSGSITNGSKLPVEIIIINNSSSDITLNIGVAGSDSNELGLPDGKTLITETFNTGTESSGEVGEKTTTVDYSYTGAVQTATLKAGTHKLEVWGASGGTGNPSANIGGKGGYSYGTLTLTSDTNVYIYVGQEGKKQVESSTFGGGGQAEASSSYNSGQGGGASDIRIKEDSLYARVIVAGGGGGGAGANETTYIGGYGGGLTGGSANANNSGAKDTVSGATQTSAGNSTTTYSSSQLSGSFGTGGYYGGGGTRSGGAGGGGWYGGGAGSYGTAGSGGSGYVYTSSTASSYPSGGKLNNSYYLTNASTIGGNTSFTDNSGSTVTGHSGNGYARITSTIKVNTTPSIDTSSVILKPDPVTNLKDIVTCKDNGSGCKIVLVSPTSTKNMKENTTNTVVYVLENNAGKRYKYTKKIKIINSILAIDFVKELNDGTTGDSGSGVYKVTHSAIPASSSATGVMIEATDDYRFYGASPNNYICLDDSVMPCEDRYLYRIIGSIYEELEKKYRIKVIKATPLTDGTNSGFVWNTEYNNIWATITNGNYSDSLTNGATIMVLLNSGDWWNGINKFANYGLSNKTKELIKKSRFYLGSVEKTLPEDVYIDERGISRYDNSRPLYWDGFVALLYSSDFGYAYGMKCATSENLMYGFAERCYANSWLGNELQWIITPTSNSTETALLMRTVGSIGTSPGQHDYGVYYENIVKPTFYLTSSTLITGGTGTENDPYLISK